MALWGWCSPPASGLSANSKRDLAASDTATAAEKIIREHAQAPTCATYPEVRNVTGGRAVLCDSLYTECPGVYATNSHESDVLRSAAPLVGRGAAVASHTLTSASSELCEKEEKVGLSGDGTAPAALADGKRECLISPWEIGAWRRDYTAAE